MKKKTDQTWSMWAEWVVPGEGPPIRGGVLQGTAAVIEYVGPAGSAPPAPLSGRRRLADTAILPGLVNAHTHLELTCLRGQLPRERPMNQWVFALLGRRPKGRKQDKSVADGAQQCLAFGTTTVADISYNNRAWKVLKASPLRKVCFAEVTGIGPEERKAIPRLKAALRGARGDARLRFGLSPHAPYSTAEDVYRKVIALARRKHWPVTTHLAESEAERQFLLRGSGKFFDLLAALGLIDLSVAVHGCTPMAYAQRTGLLDEGALLAHVNALDDDEFRLLAASPASVALCPRSNDFFGRSGHRYAEMLAAGVNVALGTDSLASNDSLDMLEEMRTLRLDGKVSNADILRMATLNGARALRMDDKIGSLAPGKQADWVAVRLGGPTPEPMETILTTPARVLETTIAGTTVYQADETAPDDQAADR
ncbi:MAG: Atrazine chlorohydrolase [Planctomycetes bacterium ADurb.Bin126]|nr:MAG: Atrazine chlorohydrolase [Planctomycetes bacterium ADurb.Bin126]HQL75334.1 amidohydrolase family protein [Phycisphaerae bacterium]